MVGGWWVVVVETYFSVQLKSRPSWTIKCSNLLLLTIYFICIIPNSMYYKPTFEAFLATFNNLLRYICSSLSSWLFDILYQISELNTSLLMSTDSLETKAISKKNWPKLVRFNIDIIVDSSFTLIHSVLNVLFIRPNSAGMVSRGYETAKRLLVSGLWGEGDPKRPKKNLLSPETMRPKKTQ